MNMCESHGRTAEIPLAKSTAAATRCNGVNCCSAINGTLRRTQSKTGPTSHADFANEAMFGATIVKHDRLILLLASATTVGWPR